MVTFTVRTTDARTVLTIGLWVLTCLLALAVQAQAGQTDVDRLTRRAQAIDQMNTTLENRCDQALDIRNRLDGMQTELKDEIATACKEQGITTFAQGACLPRIAYDLKLIARLRALIGLLDARIADFNDRMAQLAFFSRQIQDDMMMLNAVNHMAVDRLTERIDQTLAACRNMADDRMVDLGRLNPEPAERIWARLP